MSHTYHVSYDLKKPRQDYDALIAEIKRSPGYYHIMQSTWLISTSETAHELFRRLGGRMDNDDRILISEISNHNYTGWLNQSVWDWLRSQVRVRA